MSAPVIATANPARIQLDENPVESAVTTGVPEATAPRSTPPIVADTVVAQPLRRRWIASLTLAVLAAFGVVLWGGYTQGWDWTGISQQDTLWHWMQLLLVPIAFAALPALLRDRSAMHIERKLLMFGLAAAFVAFVIIGYSVPLEWTGFTGNTLWDWLSLLLLPMAIISVRFLHAERTLNWVHYSSAAVLLAVFCMIVLGGYLVPWDWTGFTGNTFVDWLQLLVLPILFPTVVVPAAAAWLTAKTEDPAPADADDGDVQ